MAVVTAATAACSGSSTTHRRAADAAPLSAALRTQPGTFSAFPPPGSRTASPQTQISLRGPGRVQASQLTVTGSQSGVHVGRVEVHSDGGGASFSPATPFVAGETVTVSSSLPIRGAHDGRFSFVVARPATETTPPPAPKPTAPPPPAPATTTFASAPGLHAPVVTVTTPGATDRTPVLLVTKGNGLPSALTIVDKTGGLVWYDAMPKGTAANDLKVQRYDGRPVLTYWRGTQNTAHGYGNGTDVVLDTHYHQIATIQAGNGYHADLHDLVLDGRSSAWLTAYAPVRWDLRPVGGPSDGIVLDGVVQEVDLRTGLVEFEWHSLDHIPLGRSTVSPPHDDTTAWDYVHLNSVDPTDIDEILVSARHTSAVYAVDGASGDILWTLGGEGSDFTLPAAARFGLQHDARRHGRDTITLFDDGGGPPRTEPESRALTIRLDRDHHTATLVSADRHAPAIVANSQGNVEQLADGSLFVGWGSEPGLTEFDRDGRVVWDAHLPAGVSSYRAVLSAWTGSPTSAPAVSVTGSAGRREVHLSWNGDTRTVTWRVAGTVGGARRVVTSARTGFESVVALPRGFVPAAVTAVDASGRVLAVHRVH